MNQLFEAEISKNPKEYSWEYKKFRRIEENKDLYNFQRFQKAGVNRTKSVKISNLPNIIAKDKTIFVKLESDPQFDETSPSPGPKLLRVAPTAEKELSKYSPDIRTRTKRTMKVITYTAKNPQTFSEIEASTTFFPILEVTTTFG